MSCDQLRDDVLRGLELSEKARCVLPALSVVRGVCIVLYAAVLVLRGPVTGNMLSVRRYTTSPKWVELLYSTR